MLRFAIVNHYVKDGESKFYIRSTFSSDTFDSAVVYFRKLRFYHNGTYRLFIVGSELDDKTGVHVDLLPTALALSSCLCTRVCEWIDDSFVSKFSLGIDTEDFSEGDIIPYCYRIARIVLPNIDFGNDSETDGLDSSEVY